MSKKLFGELTFGTRFTFYGKTYIKIALNMAEGEKRHGNIFQTETEVEPIECDEEPGEPENRRATGSRSSTDTIDNSPDEFPGPNFHSRTAILGRPRNGYGDDDEALGA